MVAFLVATIAAPMPTSEDLLIPKADELPADLSVEIQNSLEKLKDYPNSLCFIKKYSVEANERALNLSPATREWTKRVTTQALFRFATNDVGESKKLAEAAINRGDTNIAMILLKEKEHFITLNGFDIRDFPDLALLKEAIRYAKTNAIDNSGPQVWAPSTKYMATPEHANITFMEQDDTSTAKDAAETVDEITKLHIELEAAIKKGEDFKANENIRGTG